MCVHEFFFSSRRRHTRLQGDWSSDVCSSDLVRLVRAYVAEAFEVERFQRLANRYRKRVLRAQGASTLTSPDRKSTRLNSSHLVISYAVFCLKKKKNKNTRRN